MNLFKPSSLLDLLGVIVLVALATSVLRRGSNAARVIKAFGDAFNGAIRVATR